MKKLSILAGALCMGLAAQGYAAEQARDRVQTQTTQQIQTQAQEREQERVYGSELMTPQERLEYQNRVRAAKTQQEREQIRLEHHKQMQERAKAQGKTLRDMPPAGMGPGSGMGPGGGKGMGPGGRGY
ncbi:MAG: hypothetical protein ACK4UX_00330 [Thiobacillus sp.]